MIASASQDIALLNAIPGRIRVHFPNWHGRRGHLIEKRVREVPGVRHVEANSVTGNALVLFDSERIAQHLLLEQIRSAIAEPTDEEAAENGPPPSVLHERSVGHLQRVRIAVRGLDRDPHFAKQVIRALERHAGVRAKAIPLTGHVLVERDPHAPSLNALVAEVVELEPPPLPNEERPTHPLDPAPLLQAVVRTTGSAIGLTVIAARMLAGADAKTKAVKVASTVAAAIGLFRSFPTVRHGLRKIFGHHFTETAFSVATITSLTAARSPLGLAVMGAEAYVLLRKVIAQRTTWQRYEHHHGIAPEFEAGTVIRLETDDCVPTRAKVVEGTGTALHRDGLPLMVHPGVELLSGARIARGPLIVELKEGEDFIPRPRPSPPAPEFVDRYLRYLGPASLAYAGLIGLATRSLPETFKSLLLVNPRTALGGTEAANLDTETRLTHSGIVVVGSRADRVIQCPDLLLFDGVRVLTNGLELSRVLPFEETLEPTDLLDLAAEISAAAGSPWGRAFPKPTHETTTEGEFDGTLASAFIRGKRYHLQAVEDFEIHPKAKGLRDRGEYLLQLTVAESGKPLALIALRHKVASGVEEVVDIAKRNGVRLGIVPGGNQAAEQALSHRIEIPLVVSSNAVTMIRKAQKRGAYVAFVSDNTDSAEGLADSDLAIGMTAGHLNFPTRVDLLVSDLTGLGSVIESGARRDAAVRDAVLLSMGSNLFGAVWGALRRPGIERASFPVYLGILSAVSDGLIRLSGGRRAGVSLAYLVDPHPERWGRQSIEDALRAFASSPEGLTDEQAVQRRKHEPRGTHRGEILNAIADQIRYPTTGILAGAAIFSLILNRRFDFSIIVTTIGVNVAVGAWQEVQANRTSDALKKMGRATAQVLRTGERKTVPEGELVPGDIILLQTGDRVAADARLLSSHSLEVDESALTGESFPVHKSARNGTPEDHVVLKGSDIVVGTGTALVVATGRQTRMGTLAAALDVDETAHSPLGVRLGQLLWQSLPLTIGASSVVVLSGLLRRQPLAPQLLVGASMALAAVPEGLPLLAGIGQAGVARRLARRHAIVRRLAAVEALGRVDVACADKTGTMTEGRLQLGLVADADNEARFPGELSKSLENVLLTAAYASPHPEESGASAHPTDGAVLEGAVKAGLGELLNARRVEEIPFDPTSGFHATIVHDRVCVKGAPETVVPRCIRLHRPGGEEEPLDDEGRHRFLERARRFAEQGLRVLVVAEQQTTDLDDDPRELVALGLLGIRDPLRATVNEAVKRCHAAGIRVIMITGDHPATARNIARESGLPMHNGSVLTGSEMMELDDDELARRLETTTVIARATPLDKLQIIKSLQKRGHTVAMTGDGVNDSPALRIADVGVAMGRGGTEVARQAADIVLADDDFATLVEALVEGRGFWRNMRRSLGLLLGGNLGELGLIAGASVLGFPNPMNPPQILIVNLITDVLPALAVVLQQPEHRDLSGLSREGVTAIDQSLRTDVVRRALLTGGPSLASYLFTVATGRADQANTVAFSTIVGNQLAQTYEAGRIEDRLSRPVVWAIAGSASLLATTLLAPPLRRLLGLTLPTPFSCTVIGASALFAARTSRSEFLSPTNNNHTSAHSESSQTAPAAPGAESQ